MLREMSDGCTESEHVLRFPELDETDVADWTAAA